MMKILYIIPVLFLIFSYSDETNLSPGNDDPIMDNLKGFPLKWIEGEVSEDGITVIEYCEISNQELWIENNDNGWEITVNYGHDAEIFALQSVHLEEKEVELYNVVTGYFTVVSQYTGEVEEKSVMWNKDEQFCRFDGFFDGTFFVDKSKMKEYTIIEEICE